MIRTFKYRLHPNAHQERVMSSWLVQCCELYNGALEQRIIGWAQRRRFVSRIDQQKQLTELRASDPAWSATPALVQRSALHRLDQSFVTFFRRVQSGVKAGHPRFQSARRYDSFSVGVSPFVKPLKKDRVHVPKLGHVKLNLYRPIDGEVRDVIIRRDRANRWWVSFACDIGEAPAKTAVARSVGIDLGLTTLAVLSNGEEIANPRYLGRAESRIADGQRSVARKQSGSRSRERARIRLARAYAHVSNQRLDLARKTASVMFQRFDLVAHEDLSIDRMTISVGGHFAKSINDVSWGILLRCLASKAEYAGKWLVPVNPMGTSQRCSSCGEVVPKTLSERTHACPYCGLTIGRDHNAAINVLALGQSALEPGRLGEGEVSSRGEADGALFHLDAH